MKKRNKLFLLVIFCMIFSVRLSIAQNALVVYQTYEDYENETGIVYEGDFIYTSRSTIIDIETINRAINNNNVFKFGERKQDPINLRKRIKVKLQLANYWGFKINEHLFRIKPEDNFPYYLVSQGEFCYYENGLAILKMLKQKMDLSDHLYYVMERHNNNNYVGDLQVFSKTINSKILKFEGKWHANKIIKKYPEFQKVKDCVFPHKTIEKFERTRACFEKFP